MRIASLVPSATETLFALGLGESVVGVTHECDYPARASALPALTRNVLPEGLSAAEIDRAVRERTGRGESIYALDAERLQELEPDLIVTQALCEVCAVAVDDVRALAAELDPEPRVLSLDPTTIGEVVADFRRLAEAAGATAAGERLVRESADRIDSVRAATPGQRPAVVALEWLDPPFAGGHWVPQMIELAGGDDVLGLPGERSREVGWADVAAAEPEVVIAMPCGYGLDEAVREALLQAERLAALGARVVAVDAAAYFSRPGPRLVDGVELLAQVLRSAPEPGDARAAIVDLAAAPTSG